MSTIEESRERLEAEVQRHLQKKQAQQQDDGYDKEPEELPARTSDAGNIAAAIAAKIYKGKPLPTAEELAAAEKESQERHRIALQQLYKRNREGSWEKICPPRFREPFDVNKVTLGVDLRAVETILGWQHGERGLYIYGETGHSKTRALQALLRRLIVDEHRSVKFYDGNAFAIAAGRAFGSPEDTEAWLLENVQADLFVIDDMAKRWTPATADAAFTIIDRRVNHRRPVIVTINYTAAEMIQIGKAGGEVASLRDVATPMMRRIADYCQTVVL